MPFRHRVRRPHPSNDLPFEAIPDGSSNRESPDGSPRLPTTVAQGALDDQCSTASVVGNGPDVLTRVGADGTDFALDTGIGVMPLGQRDDENHTRKSYTRKLVMR